MKHRSPTRPSAEIDPTLLLDANVEEVDTDTDEDELYSDEFLDEFMQNGMDDDEDDDFDHGYSRAMKLDGDDDFDSYFREADGYSPGRRHRRHRGRGRRERETFEFEPYDRSDWRAHNQRRPRRSHCCEALPLRPGSGQRKK